MNNIQSEIDALVSKLTNVNISCGDLECECICLNGGGHCCLG